MIMTGRNGRILTLLFLFGLGPMLAGQQIKQITLDDIYREGIFSPERLSGLNSMKDGVHYTIQKENRIEQYSYQTGEMTQVLFNADQFDQIGRFSGYSFSDGEDRILIETDRERIYRRSYLASYWVFDIPEKTLQPVSKQGKQQLGAFSPDGSRVAFFRDNNLFIRHLDQEKEVQITFDGEKNAIINGAPDWVYEEEFGFARGFYWSPDGDRIAFYRFDERRVREFHMTMFGELYPEPYRFKYPKAGEENAIVTIHVYDLQSGATKTMDTGEDTNVYFPRIKWTRDPEVLSIMRLNRLQNQLEVLHADAATGESRVVYREENRYYISEASDNTITYLPDKKHLILISERDGYFHFYLYDFVNGVISPITSGPFDIDDFVGYDEKDRLLYYTSCEVSPLERHLYSIRLDGKRKKQLSLKKGTNRADFSQSFEYYILTHSTANTPPEYSLHRKDGKLIRVLEDNAALRDTIREYGFTQTEFLTVHTAGGQELNAWMLKPADFEPEKEYPLFVYVYGGPESQNVTDAWGGRTPWFQMLAQQGYIVACVDNRGTNGRGEEFRKATYMRLGEPETIDQLDAARWFGALDWVDEDRMGIFGWSYGGFMTSLCMTKGEGLFRMGIAVAPVTSWRYYDTVYTERFMRTPGENPEGYDSNSPVNFADGLRGKFLLVHGSGDDNVHFQNSMDFAEALVQADKQFEMQFYPNKAHGISGGNTTYHLYTRMTGFILENL